MNYDQYQQLYSAAKEQIADRVAKIQPRAGNGASVNGMGISIEVPAAEEDVGLANRTLYYLLAWLGQAGSFDTAWQYDVLPSGEVNAAFPFDVGVQDPFSPIDPTQVKPSVLTLQFLANTSIGGQDFRYQYAFPVRVTLVQSYDRVNPDQTISVVPLRTVTVDLRSDPVTTTFYSDISEIDPRLQLVRVTKLVRI